MLKWQFLVMRMTIEQLYPDIWHQIFEYFNPIELFHSLVHLTVAVDEVLFNRNHRFRLRRLVVDANVETLPRKLPLRRIISLELHQEGRLDIIGQCLKVRSLKLVGQAEWVIHLLRKVSYIDMKLEQLVLVVPGIGSLYDLLASVALLSSLRRLAIYANELEEKIKTGALSLTQTKIENFTLHSCSSISWNDLSHMASVLSNIRFLDITLFHNNKDSSCWFTFPKLRYICLTLLEVPFQWIIHLVKTMPSLVKLKLNGIINSEGYVINDKWHNLFNSCSSLDSVTVNVSLERDNSFFDVDMVRAILGEINLNLICIDDDCDYYYSDKRNQHRWWNLSGIIAKQHEHT